MKPVLSLRPCSVPRLAILAAFLLAGCATNRAPVSVHYRTNQNETVYRTVNIDLGPLFESGGLGQDPRVGMRGWATCPGENCQPREAWLSFSLQRAAKQMQLVSDRSVTLRTDEEVYSWEQKNVVGSRAPTHGEIARIALGMDALKDVATAQNVTGTIGSEEFSLSREERAPLRALYEKATADGAEEEAPL